MLRRFLLESRLNMHIVVLAKPHLSQLIFYTASSILSADVPECLTIHNIESYRIYACVRHLAFLSQHIHNINFQMFVLFTHYERDVDDKWHLENTVAFQELGC